MQFRHITERQGLKHTWINHITKDSRDYMWFSTMYGAYRYDGFGFEEYVFDNTQTGQVARVNFVFEDSSKRLWFGTDDGLYCRAPGQSHDVHYSTGKYSPVRLSSSYIECMVEDLEGNLWVAGHQGVDMLRKDGSVKNWDIGSVGALLYDSRQRIWAGTAEGCFLRLEPVSDEFNVVELPMDISAPILSLFQNSENDIYICTSGAGLLEYSLPQHTVISYDVSSGTLPDDHVRCVAEDSYGNVYAATERGIVRIYDGGQEFIISNEHDLWSLNDNAVYSIFCDEDDNLWAGTFFGGVNVMYRHFSMFDFMLADSEGYSTGSKVVSCIVEIDGHLYVGTENDGLYIYPPSGEPFHISSLNSNLSTDNIHSICQDSRGNLWIGTYYGGLYMKSEGSRRFKVFREGEAHSGELDSNNIYSVFEDSCGNLWVGTQYGGLYRYDYGQGVLKKFTEGMPENLFVWDIYEDKVGDIWLASHGSGIWRLSADEGYEPQIVVTAPRHFITICELADGRMLFGTEKEGIVCVDPMTLECEIYTTEDGLPDNTVYGILQADDSDIWLSTNSGLCRTDKTLAQYSMYTINEGLPTNRFNYNSCTEIDGKLYFGSINGVVIVDPSKEIKLEAERLIRFNNLYINNIKHEITSSEIELEHWQNTFGIDFSANVFGQGWCQSFAYRMHGIDDNWHIIGNRHRVDFLGLKPGRYTLMVAGVNEGHVMDNVSILNLRIVPVWWQSIVARLAVSILVLLLIGYLIRLFLLSSRHKHELDMEKLAREKDKEINEMKFREFKNMMIEAYRDRETNRKIELDISRVEVVSSNSDEMFLRKVADIIFAHLSDSEFGVDSLCMEIGMSKATLYRKLKSITGQSTNEFMQSTRLKFAARLLRETDKSVSDVGYEVGFSDPYYFSRAFKKLFGVSPKQWRQDMVADSPNN